MKLTEISVTTTGLYAWGQGFNGVTKADGWDRFWRNYSRIFWRVGCDEFGSVFLSTTYGGGMIHPMDFTLLLREDLPSAKPQIEELDEALRDLARELKFTYRIQVRELVADGTRADWALFSTEAGVEDAPPGRTGVPQDSPPEAATGQPDLPSVGPGPYRAEIVTIRGAKLLTVVGTRYQSEESAVRAIVKQARTLRHTCGGYTRHWITEQHEHIVDYGSHTFYGRITSKGKDN